jgi:hypothetical protein
MIDADAVDAVGLRQSAAVRFRMHHLAVDYEIHFVGAHAHFESTGDVLAYCGWRGIECGRLKSAVGIARPSGTIRPQRSLIAHARSAISLQAVSRHPRDSRCQLHGPSR